MASDGFLKIIKNIQKLSIDQPIIIGFSGGIDSVCLLDLMVKAGKKIIVAHYNHGIRENADRDEKFSLLHSKRYNALFVSEKSNVKEYALNNNLSIEEAARKKRYDFLFRIARENKSNLIAVAHHADDQVETVFMHLMRGSGMSGLAGMREFTTIPEFDHSIKIYRPLLSIWRDEIEEYCKNNELDFIIDETNFSTLYERNRIRQEILPYLIERYPGLSKRLLNLSNVLQKDDELLQDLTIESWDLICLEQHIKFFRLSSEELRKLPLALQRRIIRHAAYSFKPDLRDLSYKNVENVLNFLQKKSPGEIDLQENIIAVFSSDEIILGSKDKNWIELIHPQIYQTFQGNVFDKKEVQISENWYFEMDITSLEDQTNLSTENEFSVLLDAEKVGDFLGLRSKIDGDIFQPLGMEKGIIKISDFFINEKLMMDARKNYPLVVDANNEIIWIPGFRLNHKYRITNETKRILKLSILRKKN